MDLLQPLFPLPRPVRFPALTYSVLLFGRPYKNYNSPTDCLIPSILSACSSQLQAPSGQGYVVPLTALVWIRSHVCGPNEHFFPFPHITKSFPHSMAQGQCLLLSLFSQKPCHYYHTTHHVLPCIMEYCLDQRHIFH